jgi:pilus assembly protein CpaE
MSMSMTNGIPKLVILGCRDESAALAEQVEGLAHVVAIEANLALGALTARTHQAEIALIFMDHEPSAALELTRQLGRHGESVPVVVSTSKDPDNILSAMRAGARDFAYLDADGSDLARAVRALVATKPTSGAPTKQGKVIALFGCKGGSGATTIAINLAGALMSANGEDPARVVVLDLNLELGDVLVFLDLSSRYNFHDLLANMHRLDADLLQHSLATHKSGLRVLSQTDQLEEAPDLGPQDFGKLITFLKQHFDFIVIDGLDDFRELSLAALDRADFIACTMTQDIPALKNANRCLKIFKRLGYADDRTRLILNRYRNTGALTTHAISDALGRKIDGVVSNDFPSVIKAVNEGRLLHEKDPGSKVAKDIADLVKLFHEVTPAKKRGLFARWGKG